MGYDLEFLRAAPARILVVDDEPMNIRVIKDPLQDEGHEVLVATNGPEALDLMAAERPDLVLLDILMPQMDGYEVCQCLQRNPQLRDIPVIFVTALGSEEDESRGFFAGGVDYVTKPISVQRLKVRVRNQLQMQQIRRRLEERNQMLEEMAQLREQVEQITRHDLKTPLNAVIGFTAVLESQADWAAEQQRILGAIRQAGYRMLDMINRSLDLYKMEAGVYALEPTPVDLLAIFRQLSIRAGGVTVALSIDGAPAETVADTLRIRGEEGLCFTLFGNLLQNAEEAIGASGGGITVDIRRHAQQAEVTVHNPGAVPEGIKDRFFEKFVTAGKQKGTGLGAYSARLLAAVQGGDIMMCSSPQRGTTVAVQLPLWQVAKGKAGRIVFDPPASG